MCKSTWSRLAEAVRWRAIVECLLAGFLLVVLYLPDMLVSGGWVSPAQVSFVAGMSLAVGAWFGNDLPTVGFLTFAASAIAIRFSGTGQPTLRSIAWICGGLATIAFAVKVWLFLQPYLFRIGTG